MKGRKIMFTIFLVVLTIGLVLSFVLPLIPWIQSEEEITINNSLALSEPIIQKEEPPPRYNFQEEEIYLLAQLLCGQEGVDGDGEYDFEYMLGLQQEIDNVLYVVMNRVMAEGLYANNVTDVVLQPGAFTVMPGNLTKDPSKKVIEVVRGWCSNYTEIQTIPSDHYWFSADGKGGNVTRGEF